MTDPSKRSAHGPISATAIRFIEVAVEEQFFHRALAILKERPWNTYKDEPHSAPRAARYFMTRYMDLLVAACAEYVMAVKKYVLASKRSWHKVESEAQSSALKFVERRFVSGSKDNPYYRPWTGKFLLKSQNWIDPHLAQQEWSLLAKTAPGFGEEWESFFNGMVLSGSWKERAMAESGRRSESLTGENRTEMDELPTWKDIQGRKVITQKYTARLLDISPRTIFEYVRQRRLDKTGAGKIICNDKLKVEMQRKWVSAFRLM